MAYKCLPSFLHRTKDQEPTYRPSTRPLTHSHPKFTVLQLSPSSSTIFLFFTVFFVFFLYFFLFDARLYFKVSKSFYKLSRSLCELKSPYHPTETTISLLRIFEIKVKIAYTETDIETEID